MVPIFDPILKGLLQWIYSLFLDLINYVAGSLLELMSADLGFFLKYVPIVSEIYPVIYAIGWAVLIGNMVFQALKAMLSGLGFESESPAVLLVRTGIFAFLLVCAGEISRLCLSITSTCIDLIGIPSKITITMPEERLFDGLGASWLLVIIIGFIIGWQLIKLFLEIGERFVTVNILHLLAPLGFSMGGSKATSEIFSGFIRCFASMQVLLFLNVISLRLILSTMSAMPTGSLVIPWCVLLVAIVRVSRKLDNLITRIGLTPHITGDPLSRSGLTSLMVAKSLLSRLGNGGGPSLRISPKFRISPNISPKFIGLPGGGVNLPGPGLPPMPGGGIPNSGTPSLPGQGSPNNTVNNTPNEHHRYPRDGQGRTNGGNEHHRGTDGGGGGFTRGGGSSRGGGAGTSNQSTFQNNSNSSETNRFGVSNQSRTQNSGDINRFGSTTQRSGNYIQRSGNERNNNRFGNNGYQTSGTPQSPSPHQNNTNKERVYDGRNSDFTRRSGGGRTNPSFENRGNSAQEKPNRFNNVDKETPGSFRSNQGGRTAPPNSMNSGRFQ